MASTRTAVLAVRIVSDAREFSSAMDTSVSRLDKFKNAAAKMAVPAGAVLAGLGTIAVGMGKLASEAEQNFGAVDSTFKEHAQSVKDMAKTAANTLGLSSSDYAKYSALIGSQLKNLGTPMDQLGADTNKLIGYAADFSAKFGGTVPDAVEALSSALKGEMDPIEKYGISLNQAKIDAEASALGFAKVGGAWEDSAKKAAIMSLIAKQGGDALGQFGREADTAAGAQARATANWEDASAKLGETLLPIMTFLAEKLSEFATWVTENKTLVEFLAVGLGLLAGAVLVLNGALFIMNVLAAVNPFVLIAVAVGVLIGVIVWLATQTTFFQDTWATMCKNAEAQFGPLVQFVKDAWNNTVRFLQDSLGNIGRWFADVFNGAKGVADTAIRAVTDGFNNIVNGAKNAINWVRNLFNGFSVPGWLRSVMSFMGVGGTGFNVTGDFATFAMGGTDSGMGIGATGGMSLGAVFGGGGKAPAIEQTTVNITVNGALDSASVAEQVFNLVQRHSKNTGQQVAVRIA